MTREFKILFLLVVCLSLSSFIVSATVVEEDPTIKQLNHALHKALKNDDLVSMDQLLKSGVDPNVVNKVNLLVIHVL